MEQIKWKTKEIILMVLGGIIIVALSIFANASHFYDSDCVKGPFQTWIVNDLNRCHEVDDFNQSGYGIILKGLGFVHLDSLELTYVGNITMHGRNSSDIRTLLLTDGSNVTLG